MSVQKDLALAVKIVLIQLEVTLVIVPSDILWVVMGSLVMVINFKNIQNK